MMNKLSILGGVIGTLLLSAPAFAITGTDSVSARFTTTIEAGTCTAEIQDATGKAVSELGFGDVFKSELVGKSRTVPFKIAFSNCAGVKSAELKIQPGTGGGCSGPSTDGDSFAAGKATAFEVWKGDADNGTILSCNQTVTQPQTITISGSAQDVDLTSRIVIAKSRTIANVTEGEVKAPVTFVVTYQ